MTGGSCFCGKVRIAFDGQPKRTILCHCNDCRKLTGSAYSTLLIVPNPAFRVVSGATKETVKTADSGKTVTLHHCGDCCSPLFGEGVSFGDNKFVLAGIMDDSKFLEPQDPSMEVFVNRRLPWVPEITGAMQISKEVS